MMTVVNGGDNAAGAADFLIHRRLVEKFMWSACWRMMAMTAGVAMTASVTLAEWQVPRDGAVTEKQLANYLQVQKEALDTWRAAGKAIEGSQSSAAAIALALRTDEKFKASLASHGMTPDEYSWVGSQVWQAYSTLI